MQRVLLLRAPVPKHRTLARGRRSARALAAGASRNLCVAPRERRDDLDGARRGARSSLDGRLPRILGPRRGDTCDGVAPSRPATLESEGRDRTRAQLRDAPDAHARTTAHRRAGHRAHDTTGRLRLSADRPPSQGTFPRSRAPKLPLLVGEPQLVERRSVKREDARPTRHDPRGVRQLASGGREREPACFDELPIVEATLNAASPILVITDEGHAVTVNRESPRACDRRVPG